MKAGILIGHLDNKGNEASMIRTAEAFGINLVCIIGEKEKSYKISQGAEKHMIFLTFKDFKEFIVYTQANNHKIVCIENIDEAKEISKIEKYPVNPIFVCGNEQNGIPKELLDNASLIVQIQQGLGYANCLNTTIACSIIIHDFFKKEINVKRGKRK